MNKIQIIGRLTKNPEAFYTEDGEIILNLPLAENDQDTTNYFNVSVFGSIAEACNEHLIKGSQIFIDGYIKQVKNDDKTYWNVYANKVVFLQKPKEQKDTEEQKESKTKKKTKRK